MESKTEKIYVIGGGAAGLMAALRAARLGAQVTVLEKMDRPARKLAITGKGRCNLTTGQDLETAITQFGPNGKFLLGAFSRFFTGELIGLFEELGIQVVMERGKRFFPLSGRASDVVNALVGELNKNSVEIRTGCRARSIAAENGCVIGLETSLGDIETRRVILATGGASYPATGSTGDGYDLAAELGHSVIKPIPALVPIELSGSVPAEVENLPLKNVSISLIKDEQVLKEEFGEALFTGWGMTGPAVLSLGKTAALNMGAGKLFLAINFKPALTLEQVNLRLMREFEANGKSNLETILRRLLPIRLAAVFNRISGIPQGRKCAEVSKSERETLIRLLTDFRFHVRGVRPLSEAIVTAGGVALDEVNPKTMESKIVKGLYICGELLDLDAGTGGFNLQSAFSTGFVAGTSAV